MDPLTLSYDVCRAYVRDESETLGIELSNKILGWIRSRSISKLCNLGNNHDVYQDRDTCRVLRQISAFFKKNQLFTAEDGNEQAQTAFARGELLCRISNRRLDHYFTHPVRMPEDIREWTVKMKREIGRVLGDVQPFLDSIPERIKVTSGATASLPRSKAQPYKKLRLKNVECTVACRPYYEWLAEIYGYDSGEVTYKRCTGNRITTVPKNWKTERTIACEPTGNLPFQLAFDSYIKDRLTLVGVTLRDQSKNQRLAKRASMEDDLATIDLSMASDTVSYSVVEALLPDDWFEFLTDIRSGFGNAFGTTRVYSKFSTMGNATTFGLETLIFVAAVRVFERNPDLYAVYGDDIILPSQYTESFTKLMRFLGFHINHDKSFSTGPFRESCGADWYRGIDVTPCYITFKVRGKPGLCHVVNSLVRIATPEGELSWLLRDITIRNNLPLAPFGGGTLGAVFIDTQTAYRHKKVRQHKSQTMQQRVYTPRSRNRKVRGEWAYILWCIEASHMDRELRSADPLVLLGWGCDADEVLTRLGFCAALEKSRTALVNHRYRLRWITWVIPKESTPTHLYWWSEFLFASDG